MTKKHTSMNMKLMNKKRVLRCIREHEPVSRAEIAAKVRISKPTVSAIVDELIQEKWVLEKEFGESTAQGGRKPIHLYFNEKAFYLVGADIGGTKVRSVLCDLKGRIVAESEFPTSACPSEELVGELSADVRRMAGKAGVEMNQILGMGAGVPGVTHPENGVIIEAPSLGWNSYPFLQEAKQHFPFPVHVDNDVNVAVLGEQWLGNARQKRNVLFVSVGTGIGSGLMINGQLYRGSSYAAGEIGYMVTDKNEMKNRFRPVFHRYGFLESTAGGKSIGTKLTDAVKRDPNHRLYRKAQEGELSGKEAFELAAAGDPAAIQVTDEAIEHLAYGLINACSLLDPEVIILGGGVFRSSAYILPRLKEAAADYLPARAEMKQSLLGENAGVLGAVSLFLREHESLLNDHDEGE